ncbi:MAG: hypothetical protein ACLRNQ_11985 [Flavonifractor plautii]
MKNIKQLFVCLLAISMTISVSAHAIATDAMESAISPIVITATEFDAISAQTEHVGRIMLPHTNPEGSNGNSCGEFVANEANVAFSILSAPATESYNVQLYHGTASSGGIPVYLYAKDVPIGSGVWFSNLIVGDTYFLKLVLPPLQYPDQMPATRTKHFLFQQLRYLPMLRLILKTSVRLPTFHFHIT